LDERLAFMGIPSIVEDVLAAHHPAGELTLDAVLEAERWARAEAQGRIEACS
jgi:1-deoxy-D-xylulose-5-phosphate reductoisomerase